MPVRGRGVVACAVVALAVVCVGPLTPATGASDHTINVNATGTNGVGTISSPALPCAEGGSGDYRQYQLQASVPAGTFSALASSLVATIDVHTDQALAAISGGNNSFLLTSNSHATLENDRGTMQLGLTASGAPNALGSCPRATMGFNGSQVSGTGSWTVRSATGAYRNATGSGTFTLTAGLLPGATNPWSLALNGAVQIGEPALSISKTNAFWGNFGLDYVRRIVSVTYTITNSGPGDAYDTRLLSTTSPTAGVTPLGPSPQTLGDVPAGKSTSFTVRYQLGATQPCQAVILACTFQTVIQVDMPDAFDVHSTQSAGATVTAPVLPPPL